MSAYSKKFKNFRYGFSLLEMLVAVSIFSIVILVGVSSLFAVFSATDKARSSSVSINNVGLMLEEISRALQDGYLYHCNITLGNVWDPRDCGFPAPGANSIAFEDINGNLLSLSDQIVYKFVQSGTLGHIERSTDSGTTFERITPTDIDIDKLEFRVRGSAPNDFMQARVIILIQGIAGLGPNKEQTNFNLQTTVTQRIADN
jgi:prepilin-type N-terminal cleavage/methylation domain-containing protein